MDASAVVRFLRGELPSRGMKRMKEFIDGKYDLSFVTRIELLSWKSTEQEARDVRDLIAGGIERGLTEEIIPEIIHIRRDVGLKLPDALIVATALALRATLVADNDRDFLRVPGLDYFNPTRPR
jgi:hypothetical protein